MKVKNLRFVCGQAGLQAFVVGNENFKKFQRMKFFFIEKRSPRSYYLYAHQSGSELPFCYCRVSANDLVTDVVNGLLSAISIS